LRRPLRRAAARLIMLALFKSAAPGPPPVLGSKAVSRANRPSSSRQAHTQAVPSPRVIRSRVIRPRAAAVHAATAHVAAERPWWRAAGGWAAEACAIGGAAPLAPGAPPAAPGARHAAGRQGRVQPAQPALAALRALGARAGAAA